jgi:hypothetical protein
VHSAYKEVNPEASSGVEVKNGGRPIAGISKILEGQKNIKS